MVFGADIIAGFPTETEAMFQRSLDLVQDCGLTFLHVFPFSPRPGTPAANLHDDTPHEVKLKRLQHLQSVVEANAQKIGQSRIGTVQRILVEGYSRRSTPENPQLTGRTYCNRIVNFYGNPRLIGQMIDVRITEARTNSLAAEVLTSESVELA